MRERMVVAFFIIVFILGAFLSSAYSVDISDATQSCIECHSSVTPGIVGDWKRSVHAAISPEIASKKPNIERRVSAKHFPQALKTYAVGCAECHTMNAASHKDTFEHNGFNVHVVVTPKDCAVCHPVEVEEYKGNLMAHAYGNLHNNTLYQLLVKTTNGSRSYSAQGLFTSSPDLYTNADSCYYCHGTVIEIKGKVTKDTQFGEMMFPVLSGWPNHGVGRINPDSSMGSCTSCHSRHQFSIEMARKPYTCRECHKGPDVPAYAVYSVSKHANIVTSLGKHWNFKGVPWRVGKDFSAPTCAVCHISEIVDNEGEVLIKRTHKMTDRLPWRLLGLIYSHNYSRTPDTDRIKNSMGLQLPTELTGESVSSYLIDEREAELRLSKMKRVCLGCHSTSWVDGHFKRVRHSIKITDQSILTATKIIMDAWKNGICKGPSQGDSPFNEAMEKKWVEAWLFYGNSVRYAAAMAGTDYGVFQNGRWYLNKTIDELWDILIMRTLASKK